MKSANFQAAIRKTFVSFFVALLVFSCGTSDREGVEEEQFAKYWYQGKAEINVFDLEQIRYGEARAGKAVMIFVTEDFSKRKQVKLDNPGGGQKVLKLNMTSDFVTGIYPYHTMLSVFTPVYEDTWAPKVTASVTEWCGQTFSQLNLKSGKYNAQLFSYFESEGDREIQVQAMAEDELFNLIRLNPDLVPTERIKLIPSLISQRLAHLPMQAENATISRRDEDSNQSEIEVAYSDINRKLIIRFQKFFPYEILSFEEIWTRENGQEEITKAVRTHVKMSDYWNQNKTSFEPLRKELGL